MSVPGDDLAGFERRVRAVLEHDAGGLSGHVRSRLTRARHAAMAGARTRRDMPHWRLLRTWLPATATAAAALAAVWLLGPYRTTPAPRLGTGILTTQDVQLLTDRDGLALVEEGDGEFYEWAVARARSRPTSAAGGRGPGKHGG